MSLTPRNGPAFDPVVQERRIVLLVGAIQFVNVLDFMMVMPLGPDFAAALNIDTSHIGLVGGAYTASAAVTGLLGSLFLDRYDRRTALALAILGLVIATAAGGFATGIGTLVAARILAGAFGGPATSLSLAIIADTVPPTRRGKALGSVMAAFSVASVLGVPAGLELSRRFGFRAPFFAVALLGLVVAALSIRVMPQLTAHLDEKRPTTLLPTFDRLMLISLCNTTLTMLGVFSVVPNISAFVQHNLGYPREQLGLLYLVGGIASFVTMRAVGNLVDRWGAVPLIIIGTIFHVVALKSAFIDQTVWLPILVIFTLYMLSGSLRMVPLQTLASRVPVAHQRARFMSVQSCVQHLASALGAFRDLTDTAPHGALCRAMPRNGAAIALDQLAELPPTCQTVSRIYILRRPTVDHSNRCSAPETPFLHPCSTLSTSTRIRKTTGIILSCSRTSSQSASSTTIPTPRLRKSSKWQSLFGPRRLMTIRT